MATHPSAPPPTYDQVTGTAPDHQQSGYSYGGNYGKEGMQPPASSYPNQPGYPPQGQPAPNTSYYPPQSYPASGSLNLHGGSTNTSHVDTHSEVSCPMGNMSSFSDKNIRRNFIKKVYLILMVQLLITFACAAVFSLVDDIKIWVQGDGRVCYYVSYATFIVTYFVLICVPSVRRKTPGNYICLAVFTLVFSYMVGTISSFYDTYSVLIAAGITALVCLSVSLFAIQTKIDFTMCSGLLFVLVMVLFFFGWSVMIVYFTIGFSYILHCVYAGVAALVFTLFLVYDTQMIVGGRKHELSPEEYIYGALQLYIDVVYIFLIILSLFGKSN
ncbi:protein lifeguard 3-like [Mizuhopecten yessoensis]|uniref:protein lifeguard 3-like n=1 Tax=Mizuhopecten yessoensis TaxID=6573 RepID=UPI000B45B8BE|nr:protein lifeguard 3-like [Mizuhopecten yessoensis]